MTDEQIIKAVDVCRDPETCEDCPYHELYTAGCVAFLMTDAFALINRQKEEIEKLDKQCQAARRKNLSLCGRLHNASTENAELKQKNRKYINRIEKDIVLPTIFGEQARTEAIKEFAEELKNRIWYSDWCPHERTITPEIITALVKEMTEEQE